PEAISAVRVGYLDGQIVINPTNSQRDLSDLDLIVAGTKDALVMVEAGAREVDESVILNAFDAAHAEIKRICSLQEELRAAAGAEADGRPGLYRNPPHQHRPRRPSSHSWFGDLHARRNAGARHRDARDAAGSAEDRGFRRGDVPAFHAALQLPAVLGGRSEVH